MIRERSFGDPMEEFCKMMFFFSFSFFFLSFFSFSGSQGYFLLALPCSCRPFLVLRWLPVPSGILPLATPPRSSRSTSCWRRDFGITFSAPEARRCRIAEVTGWAGLVSSRWRAARLAPPMVPPVRVLVNNEGDLSTSLAAAVPLLTDTLFLAIEIGLGRRKRR